MTKNHIFAKDILEIIGFPRKFKESRTNLNVSEQFKNFSDSKENQVLLRLFQKSFQKVLNVSSFSRNQPITWETFGVFFAKVIDMTRLYILIIFYIKKRFPDLCEILLHISGKKGKEPIRYMVVMTKYVIHPKNFWTSQIFPESNVSAPARYFSLCRVYLLPIFSKNVFGQKCLYVFLCIGASICIGRETLFLPYAEFFNSLSEMEVGHIL